MHKKGLFFSMDKEITPGKLKDLKDLPDLDYQNFQKTLEKNKIDFVVDGESTYPNKLKLIKGNPYILYYKGNINLLNSRILGIVGPRKASTYGQKVLETMFDRLEGLDLCTISGMAPGIDTLAHTLSIKKNIPTIAVLGGGIFYYQNRVGRYLMDSIIEGGGAILSQFKLDFEPTKYSFPQRNKIIAGLSDVIFLPEAGLKSGSLITADFGLEMNKKIYGTPNGIFDEISAGLNEYIKKGKILQINDIKKFVEENFGENNKVQENNLLNAEEQEILDIVSKFGQVSINEFLQYSKKDISQIMTLITNLEIYGCIYEISPGIYQKN